MTPEILLRHLDDASPWPQGCGLEVGEAYERALSVRQLRIGRGEQPRGYKVGFTNRTIWERYGVHAPIWGTVWNTTLSFCEGEGEIALAGTCQPRIEPECVFGLQATPPARATLDQLLACIEWIAPGFEIVQSHMPDWKFNAADTVADSGLHGRLLVGRKLPVAALPREAAAFDAQLAAARITLTRNGERIDAGRGANVLDGPLHALAHFVAALRDCPGAPDLLAGDVVTTGTWTDAWPVHRGEQWRAEFDPPLVPLAVRFV
ncbi:2-keto-4-pentenoate hydratase [Ramlibacter alkalitolerans]|uniref:Fumarylacetoacetate hydrolase family protein n=1 Tax=Ramlibacter alkalitolerans TaxID=2039631 RepID=A0ABS1JVS1_9BURK|nr:fumarylacetoacetate hydrolase family protein [Ramlibacter alkalitolerans]MBL0428408.1 fumarylacetoacetate hydrolase family protein [Ramlibacter alkalitolerans]